MPYKDIEDKRAAYRLWAKNNPDKIRDKRLRYSKRHNDKRLEYRYGITKQQHDALLSAQLGQCAICKASEAPGEYRSSLVVDHDHKTGVVRGILCQFCNCAISRLSDDIALMRRSILYLSDTIDYVQEELRPYEFNKFKDRELRYTHNVDLEMYWTILAKQGYRCAICDKDHEQCKRYGSQRYLTVDHDHSTGIVRGVLCQDCNSALGFFRDNITTIARAIEYLCR